MQNWNTNPNLLAPVEVVAHRPSPDQLSQTRRRNTPLREGRDAGKASSKLPVSRYDSLLPKGA
jgi:hypothetical protein